MSEAEERAVLDDLVALCTKHGRAPAVKGMLTLIHRWCRQGIAMADAAGEGRPPQVQPARLLPTAHDPKHIGPLVNKLAKERKP